MTYKDYMAPLEGITNHIYRNAYREFYRPMEKYFTPFLPAKQNKRLSAKEIREVSPEFNEGMNVVPQILGNNAEDFIQLAKILKEEYGHKEVNLNLGCPSGTVTAKGKGAGFLGEPEKLDAFLDAIYSRLDMEISIKTRVGTDYEEDWEYLMGIYEKYPVKELIIHPRLLKDYYKFTPRLELFRQGTERLKMPLVYNGNLFTSENYVNFTKQFPEIDTFMYGRGIIANPGLLEEIHASRIAEKKEADVSKGIMKDYEFEAAEIGIKSGKTEESEGSSIQRSIVKKGESTGYEMEDLTTKMPDKQKLRAFHDRIYTEYQKLLSGEKNTLFRMKELWNYMAPGFTNYEKAAKKIKKAQHFSEYEAAVSCIFAEDWKPDGTGVNKF